MNSKSISIHSFTIFVVIIFCTSCNSNNTTSFNSIDEALKNKDKATWLELNYGSDLTLLDKIQELTNLTYLSIKDSTIKSFPRSMIFPKSIVFLTLNTKSANFPRQISEIDSLYELTITCKDVIIPNEFSHLSKLKVVKIRNSNLDSIPNNLLKVPNIHTLDLTGNRITQVEGNIFVCEKPLIELRLNSNPIEKLPLSLFNSGISWLRLSDLKLSELPKGIKFTGTSIDLSNNRLSELPNDFEADSLLEIFLGANEFRDFPIELTRIKNICRVISIGSNSIQTLPVEIKNLKRLQNFVLDNNQIAELPKEIGKMTDLESLSLRGNKLLKLPDEIKNLKHLKILNLIGHDLSVAERRKVDSLFSQDVRIAWSF